MNTHKCVNDENKTVNIQPTGTMAEFEFCGDVLVIVLSPRDVIVYEYTDLTKGEIDLYVDKELIEEDEAIDYEERYGLR